MENDRAELQMELDELIHELYNITNKDTNFDMVVFLLQSIEKCVDDNSYIKIINDFKSYINYRKLK